MRRCPAGWGVERDNASRTSQPRGPVIHFVIAAWRAKEAESARVKSWEIVADNLKKAGWSWGCVSVLRGERSGLRLPNPLY